MKQIIKINYKSIFKYDEDKETITYQETGYLIKENNHKIINFSNTTINISIDITDKQIILKNNNATLTLVKDADILNDYDTLYGKMPLVTRLLSFEDKDNIKIKYLLLDQDIVVSEVYILLRISPLEN